MQAHRPQSVYSSLCTQADERQPGHIQAEAECCDQHCAAAGQEHEARLDANWPTPQWHLWSRTLHCHTYSWLVTTPPPSALPPRSPLSPVLFVSMNMLMLQLLACSCVCVCMLYILSSFDLILVALLAAGNCITAWIAAQTAGWCHMC